MFGNCFCAAQESGIHAELANVFGNAFRIETVLVAKLRSMIDAAKYDLVRCGKRLRERILENFAPHRIRARLKNRPQTSSRPAAASCRYRRANSRRVM